MKMLKKTITAAVVFFALILQTGCWSQNPYEKIGFILQMGLELDQNRNLLVSITSPVIAPEVKAKVEFLSTSSERLIRASREVLSNISGKQLKVGKIQQIYFRRILHEKELMNFLKFP